MILDVSAVSSITDYFVLCTGLSTNHLKALGQAIEDQLEVHGVKPIRVDGQKASSWIVFDYGSVIIHAMLDDTRKFYGLESLWGDAPLLEWRNEAAQGVVDARP